MTPEEVKLIRYGQGPWVEEADLKEFQHKGLDCRIERNSLGALCGYVKLPENHPWEDGNILDTDVEVHGGITYNLKEDDGFWIGFDCAHSGDLLPSLENAGFSLTTKNPNPDFIKHLENLNISMNNLNKLRNRLGTPVYRDMAYVEQECRNLAEQVIELLE